MDTPIPNLPVTDKIILDCMDEADKLRFAKRSIETLQKFHISEPQFGSEDLKESYRLLCEYFGEKGQMDSWEVFQQQLKEDEIEDTHPFRSKIVLIKDHNNQIVSIREHNMIYLEDHIICLMSHSWIREGFRGIGLGEILRAIPVLDARKFAVDVSKSDARIIIVGEMESPPPHEVIFRINEKIIQNNGDKKILTKYEKDLLDKHIRHRYHKTFKIPIGIRYIQPDLRTTKEIDESGAKPAGQPMLLLLRRIGHENANFMSGKELRVIVMAMLEVYEYLDQRAITELSDILSSYPSDSAQVPLVNAGDYAPESMVS